jgi:hypothetical protein
MKYQVGGPGRIIVARFSDGDDLLAGLSEIARREAIRCAAFNIVGGIKAGRLVVGPERKEMPPVPVWRELEESHEVVGFGTIFRQATCRNYCFYIRVQGELSIVSQELCSKFHDCLLSFFCVFRRIWNKG